MSHTGSLSIRSADESRAVELLGETSEALTWGDASEEDIRSASDVLDSHDVSHCIIWEDGRIEIHGRDLMQAVRSVIDRSLDQGKCVLSLEALGDLV